MPFSFSRTLGLLSFPASPSSPGVESDTLEYECTASRSFQSQTFTTPGFLQELAGHMSKLQGTPFRCNIQHDASEVLGYVLNELLSAGVNKVVVCSSLTTSYRCLVCHATKPAYAGEVVEPIINLSVRDSLSTALRDRLSGGTVTVRCDSCNSNQDCIEQSSFLNLPDVLIFRIRRDQFSGVGGGYRSGIKMEYERNLTINSGEGEGTSSAAYHLIAVSHHVGQSFSSGHYTTTAGSLWK